MLDPRPSPCCLVARARTANPLVPGSEAPVVDLVAGPRRPAHSLPTIIGHLVVLAWLLASATPAIATGTSIDESGLTATIIDFVQVESSKPNRLEPREAPGVARINNFREAPDGSGRLFVCDLRGRMYVVQDGNISLYFDLANYDAQTGLRFSDKPSLGMGFSSFDFHPDFGKVGAPGYGRFYTNHSESDGHITPDFNSHFPIQESSTKPTYSSRQSVITEWTTNDHSADTFAGTGRELFRVRLPHTLHSIQEIAFNSNATTASHDDYGTLYIAVGDGYDSTALDSPDDYVFQPMLQSNVESVTASGFQAPNQPGNTLDKDLDTRWSVEGDGQWIEYDLGRVATVDRVWIAWYRGDRRQADFNVEVSVDGQAWVHVLKDERSSGQTVEPESYGFESTTARYVRIVGYGNSENDWNSVTEVSIPPYYLPTSILGTLLRIDPLGTDGRNGQYGIPPDNPFVGDEAVFDEIYAYGFRDPHRISWDSDGRLFLADMGHQAWDEVNIIDGEGRNYGWPEREGTQKLTPGTSSGTVSLPSHDEMFEFTYPATQYKNAQKGGPGNALLGGYVYRGTYLPELTGKYIFADIVQGRIFHADASALSLHAEGTVGELAPIGELTLIDFEADEVTLKGLLGGHWRSDIRFGVDADGEFYVMTKTDGRIRRLVGCTPSVNGLGCDPNAPVTLVATADPPLAEPILNEATLTLALDQRQFAQNVAKADVSVAGVAGLSVADVVRKSATSLTLTLAYDGTDIDRHTPVTFSVEAAAVEEYSGTALTATLTVEACRSSDIWCGTLIPGTYSGWPNTVGYLFWLMGELAGDAFDYEGESYTVWLVSQRNLSSFAPSFRFGLYHDADFNDPVIDANQYFPGLSLYLNGEEYPFDDAETFFRTELYWPMPGDGQGRISAGYKYLVRIAEPDPASAANP